jgi:hypothetical protein
MGCAGGWAGVEADLALLWCRLTSVGPETVIYWSLRWLS